MSFRSTLASIRRQVSAVGRSERGNVALTFALATLPLVGLVGAGVDYSHAISVRVELQAALDSTALMLSKSAATLNNGQLQKAAQNYFNGVFNRPEARNISISASYATTNGQEVTVNGSASVPTNFMQVMGYNSLNVTGTSTATWGMSNLQVALVLDNTGSMAQANKMPALKTASHTLLSQLQQASGTPGAVQVAIVPFTTDVNVGTSNSSASWLEWSYSGVGLFGVSTTYSFSSSNWSGCVVDRDQNYDVQNTAPTVSSATLFPVDNPLLGCPPQIMPLGYDWTALNNMVDQMTPLGETDLTIGMVWGWQALTQGLPLNAPVPPANTTRAIVFMTDGLNTANRWNNTLVGSGTVANIDARTATVCTNIKATGIVIYTIQVDTGGDSPPSTLLQNCATDIGKWFYMKNANDLVTVFSEIGTQLSQLYIAK